MAFLSSGRVVSLYVRVALDVEHAPAVPVERGQGCAPLPPVGGASKAGTEKCSRFGATTSVLFSEKEEFGLSCASVR